MPITIRAFNWDDMEAIARVHRAAEPIDHASRLADAAGLRRRWQRPGNLPEQECLVAEAGGKVVGYATRSIITGTTQAVLDGVIHPAWRRQGVGSQLLRAACASARLAGATSLDLRARDDEPAVVALARSASFELVRTWYRMWMEPLRVPACTFPQGYGWRQFRQGEDEAAYVEVVNATLGGHWGTGPISLDSITFMESLPGFEAANIVFATYQRQIVGVCTMRYLARRVGTREFTSAHIGPVGVRAEQRGLGLGHALMAASLRQARRRQMQAAELDVDSTNAPAIHVYQDCGMERQYTILWYRKDLTPIPFK